MILIKFVISGDLMQLNVLVKNHATFTFMRSQKFAHFDTSTIVKYDTVVCRYDA